MVFIICLLNWKTNPYVNVYILFILGMNLIRIPFFLTYSLGWQETYKDIPFPFNILVLCNVVFLYNYFRVFIKFIPFNGFKLLRSLTVPFFLFLFNLFFLNNTTHQLTIKFITYSAMAAYIVYFSYQISRIVFNDIWSHSSRFSNNKSTRTWLALLYVFFILLAIRLLVTYPYEYFTHNVIADRFFAPFHSLIWVFIYIVFFMNPEILYGFQRIQLESNTGEEALLSFNIPNFSWRTVPKVIGNKMDQQLSIKLRPKIHDIIKVLESNKARTLIIKHPNLNIEALSEQLLLPKSHVQFVFKYHADFSFVEYRSKIRVFHAVALMKDGFLSKNTLETLAKESGFSSYNPFYEACKTTLGAGPNEIMNRLK